MTTVMTIAIDGPAASGKSTVGRMLAEQLGYLMFDTGIMYRAVAYAAVEKEIDVTNEAAVVEMSEQLVIDVEPPAVDDGRLYTVLVDDADVTWDLRTDAVNATVSQVASYGGVREEMVARQRIIGQKGCVVMVGRDIGTVVMPDAPLKLYLTASAEERAQRRYTEKIGRGDTADYDEILSSIIRRDELDSTRDHSPLRPAADAIMLDSTTASPDEIVAKICSYLE